MLSIISAHALKGMVKNLSGWSIMTILRFGISVRTSVLFSPWPWQATHRTCTGKQATVLDSILLTSTPRMYVYRRLYDMPQYVLFAFIFRVYSFLYSFKNGFSLHMLNICFCYVCVVGEEICVFVKPKPGVYCVLLYEIQILFIGIVNCRRDFLIIAHTWSDANT